MGVSFFSGRLVPLVSILVLLHGAADAMAADKSHAAVIKLSTEPLALTAFSDPKTASVEPERLAYRNLLEHFNVGITDDLLVLPVMISGRIYEFVLDTGSSVMVYESSWKSFLGKSLRTTVAGTPAGTINIELFNAPAAQLGRLSLLTSQPVAAINLTTIRQTTGRSVAGIIGMSFLQDHIVQFDFDHGFVKFLRAVGRDAGEAIHITYGRMHLPQVVLDVRGLGATEFVIDTGCSDIIFCHRDALRLERNQNAKRSGYANPVAVTGTYRSLVWHAASVQLGGLSLDKMEFTEEDDNVLGLAYLRHYNPTFDFPNQMLYLKPRENYDAAFYDPGDLEPMRSTPGRRRWLRTRRTAGVSATTSLGRDR